MAQGKLKLQPKKAARLTKKQQNPKNYAPKIIKAKKTKAAAAQKFTKRHLAQLALSTEKLISSRVGHLELIKGLRRELEKAEKEKAAKK